MAGTDWLQQLQAQLQEGDRGNRTPSIPAWVQNSPAGVGVSGVDPGFAMTPGQMAVPLAAGTGKSVPMTREQFFAQKYNGTPPYRADMSRANIMEQSRQPTNYAGFVGAMLPNLFNGGNTAKAPAAGAAAAAGGTDWLSNALGLGSASSASSSASSTMPALSAAMGQGASTAAQTATPFTWVNGVPTQVGAGATEAAGMASYLPSLGTLAQVGGGLGGAYAAYDAFKNRDDWDDKNEWESGARRGAQIGAGLGTAFMPGIGTLAGGAGGAMWGTMASLLGGGKGKDQRGRDQFRKEMKDRGMLSDGYNLNLADGGKYDIGLDGSHKNYNVDFSREGIGDVVGSVNPLAYIIANGDKKKATDLAGYYANAASSSGNANDNALKFYKDAGIDRNQAWERIDQMVQEGKIDAGTGDAFKAGIDKAHGVK